MMIILAIVGGIGLLGISSLIFCIVRRRKLLQYRSSKVSAVSESEVTSNDSYFKIAKTRPDLD
jgi:Trk-type K+ transport system membrane component